MKPWVIVGALGIATPLILTASIFAESVEIVTYYPAPATVTEDLKVKRLAVGTTYQALNFDDPAAPVTDGTALVEGNLGAGLVGGAAPPFATAPNGATTGNLSVNDLFLRSAGAGVWVSQALAADLEPTKPYRVTLPVPPRKYRFEGGNAWISEPNAVLYPAYDQLQLWRYGVAPSDVRIDRYWMLVWTGTSFADQPYPSAGLLNPPVMRDGSIYLYSSVPDTQAAQHIVQVELTW